MIELDPYEPRPGLTHRDADWSGLRVVVAGLGISGFAAADALLERGAHVTIVDGAAPGTAKSVDERAQILSILGAQIRLGEEHVRTLPREGGPDAPPLLDLVITSPGWRPDHPLLLDAAAHGIPVWGEVELAWRMRAKTGAAPWLTVTGTNGKTTTVNMLASILRASGLRAISAGNVGTPEAIIDLENWGADPLTEQLVIDADVFEGCRAVGFTLGVPAPSMVGLVEDVLADRAFVEQRQHSAAELASLADLRAGSSTVAPHYVANALAAAALARAFGVGPMSVRDGLRGFRPDPHRIAEVATIGGVLYVNDSKATNPHAAEAALASFESVVWIAGGLLKGADIDPLVEKFAPRLKGVVVIGADRAQIAASVARHAPQVPLLDLGAPDTGRVDAASAESVMGEIVAGAAGLAVPGDVVLLAPAAASMDMFASYGARGLAFEAAVRRLAEASGP